MPTALKNLPPEVGTLLRTGGGVFSLQDAATADISAGRVEKLCRGGLLERIGRGIFASAAELARADPWSAHMIRTRGFVTACHPPVLAAGWSAVAVSGVRAVGLPPALPTVIKPVSRGSGSSRTRYGIIRTARLSSEHHGRRAGCPIVRKAWMAVDIAR